MNYIFMHKEIHACILCAASKLDSLAMKLQQTTYIVGKKSSKAFSQVIKGLKNRLVVEIGDFYIADMAKRLYVLVMGNVLQFKLELFISHMSFAKFLLLIWQKIILAMGNVLQFKLELG